MGYWAEVKNVVSKGLDLALANVVDGASAAVEKGREGLAFTYLKKDLYVQRRKLHDRLADLGDLTHDLFKAGKDINQDENVRRVMDQIVLIENECKRIETEIDALGKKS